MPENKALTDVLLAHLPHFHLDKLESNHNTIQAHLTSTTTEAICPACKTTSRHVHSRYQRTVTDLPWGSLPVTLHLRVRRFRCKAESGQRKAFCERFPDHLEKHARKTNRYSLCLQHLAVAVGGNSGSRLGDQLHLNASASTIVRHLMTAPPPEKNVPKVIGVDDFAFKRGQSYGTIIVDLERGKPIDLLQDRHANTLEAWLKEHPSVEIISRDRSKEYAKACEQGAPKAIQVLDRWHVLKNLREALERVITRHRAEINAAVKSVVTAKDPSRITSAQQEKSAATLEERTQLHVEIHRLAAHGVGQREMAIHLGVSRELIRRYSRSATPPKRRTGQRKSKGFGEFEAYMLERWAEGNRNAMLLWREIRAKGFIVAKHRIAFWMRQRIAQGREGLEPLKSKSPEKPVLPTASSQLVWLLLKEPDVLEVDELTHVNLIVQASPVMNAAREFALEFQRCVRARDVKKLETWFKRVASSEVQDFKSFAKGFDRDKTALFKALELPWSNGPVEGRVNKLKLIKRQGFGRSGFALLRKRVLHAG